ncbi:MAG TPA: 2-C-methyl-D-erythritol 4-phosphate cytidylyltransferase [Mobilitalea sp.]|nr:2-C-methyl-D-erythritol 4-phosphate cytidylyltransferase [Mobilitalea sp.]
MKTNKTTAIIVAAGQGKRMNSPVAKQFLTLLGRPVLYYSLKAFEKSSVDEIILVTGNSQVEFCKENIIEKYHINKVSRVIEGGLERYDSVYRALSGMDETDYVLIHDGARPFISTELIEKVIKTVIKHKACIVGTPVKETIKVVSQEGFITATPDRDTLWTAQTPQAFVFQSIKKAYEMLYMEEGVRRNITDDAMVYESYMKDTVMMVPGDYSNLKITTPEDLTLAQVLAEEFWKDTIPNN